MIERKVNSETVLSWETMEAQQQDMQRCIAAMPGFIGTAVSSVFQIGEAASMLSPKFKKIWDTLKSEITAPTEEAAPAEAPRRHRRRRNRRRWNKPFKVVNHTEEAAPADESVTVSDMATVPVDKIKLADDEDQKKVDLAEEVAKALSKCKFFCFSELCTILDKTNSKLTEKEIEMIMREKVSEFVEKFAYRLATLPETREEQISYLKK